MCFVQLKSVLVAAFLISLPLEGEHMWPFAGNVAKPARIFVRAPTAGKLVSRRVLTDGKNNICAAAAVARLIGGGE
jgi:hypothetical protein